MNWLKRNLFMVVGALAALALLGVAGYYLFTQYQRDAEVTTKLQEATDLFQKLNNRKPSVIGEFGRTNIAAAKVEQQRLQAVIAEQRSFFQPFATHTNIDSAAFKSLLETTIDGLQKLAERQGVGTPAKDYSYTFKSQRGTLVFEAADLMPWSLQLLEIKALCEAVFDARVHSLLSIRRAASSKRDGGYEILGRKAVTNTTVNAVATPYELVFKGFTPELAEVLDNLRRSSHCFVVKNVNVEPAGVAAGGAAADAGSAAMYVPDPSAGAAAPQRSQSAAEIMRSRYGINPGGGGGGRGAPPPPRPVYTPAGGGGVGTPARRTETVLDERPLKFTVLLEAVRLRDPAKEVAVKEPAKEPARPAAKAAAQEPAGEAAGEAAEESETK